MTHASQMEVWWRQHYREDEGVSETEDVYLTNQLEMKADSILYKRHGGLNLNFEGFEPG
jgi:hypothetical protein